MADPVACIHCGRLDTECPMVSLRFQGCLFWACTHCMPVVIHKTEEIIEKLADLVRARPDPLHG